MEYSFSICIPCSHVVRGPPNLALLAIFTNDNTEDQCARFSELKKSGNWNVMTI
jgi:hypothetical protein